MNTYTKFAKALTGNYAMTWKSYESFASAFSKIAFTEYIQETMSGPRVKPTLAQFKAAEPMFFELLESLRPSHVIVWGQRLYNNLPQTGYQGVDVEGSSGDSYESWVYELSDGTPIKVLGITHPSAAFAPTYWNVVISNSLKK